MAGSAPGPFLELEVVSEKVFAVPDSVSPEVAPSSAVSVAMSGIGSLLPGS